MPSFDPRALVGATPDELLAMKPAGWLVRPYPAGAEGFRMISPGWMPGAAGIAAFHPGAPGYRIFDRRPAPDLFVLNAALEHPLLVEMLQEWVAGDEQPAGQIGVLSEAVASLIQERLLEVDEDDLQGPTLKRLEPVRALRVVGDPVNWWRAEDDTTVPPASYVYTVTATAKGRQALGIGSPA